MAAMLEKAICAGAALFAPSRASTFSEQIVDFMNGGLMLVEVDAVQRRPGALAGHPRHGRRDNQICGGGAAGGGGGPQALQLSNRRDPRYLPEAFNYNLALGWLLDLWGPPPGAGAGAGVAVAGAGGGQGGAGGWARLQALSLAAFDGPAMAAANRFVAMYTSPAFVAVRIAAAPPPGGLPAALRCVRSALRRAGASVLYASWGAGVQRGAQQQLLLQQLVRHSGARHVMSLQGGDGEGGMAWSQVYEGSGHARHAEPALAPELALLDEWVCAKAAALLAVGEQGQPGGVVFERVAGYRRVFEFGSSLDGPCAAAAV
jgi:hypothetical protein